MVALVARPGQSLSEQARDTALPAGRNPVLMPASAERRRVARPGRAGEITAVIMAVLLGMLSGCASGSTNVSQPLAPGSFVVHMGGEMSTYVGAARP
jgi:hypothetical protein